MGKPNRARCKPCAVNIRPFADPVNTGTVSASLHQYDSVLERTVWTDRYLFPSGEHKYRPEQVRETDTEENNKRWDGREDRDEDIGRRKVSDEHSRI